MLETSFARRVIRSLRGLDRKNAKKKKQFIDLLLHRVFDLIGFGLAVGRHFHRLFI